MAAKIEALAGNWIYSADGIPMPVWVKDPDDVADYTLCWVNHIAPDDEIVAVEYRVSNTALSIISSSFDSSSVSTQVWLSGGVETVTYLVTCHITTDHGRQHDRTFGIQIGAN